MVIDHRVIPVFDSEADWSFVILLGSVSLQHAGWLVPKPTTSRSSCMTDQHVNMNQSCLAVSQKKAKDAGTCRISWGNFKLLRRDGKLSQHVPRNNPCPGSYQPPASRPMLQPPSRASILSNNVADPMNSKPTAALVTTPITSELSHSTWTSKINRIPV